MKNIFKAMADELTSAVNEISGLIKKNTSKSNSTTVAPVNLTNPLDNNIATVPTNFEVNNNYKPTVETNSEIANNYKPTVETDEMFCLFKKDINKLLKRFISFDFETTGLSCFNDRVVQIGAVLYENFEIKATFSTYINSEVPISAEAFLVNGITENTLAGAPLEHEALYNFIEFIGDAVQGVTPLVAHNAEFDINFLYNMLIRNGMSAKLLYADTCRLSKNYFKYVDNYKQTTLANYLGITINEAHEAQDDAVVCGEIMNKMLLLETNPPDVSFVKSNTKSLDLTVFEKGICAFLINVMNKNNLSLRYLTFKKQSNNFISVNRPYKTFEIRVPKFKKAYFLIEKRFYSKTGLQEETYKQLPDGNFIQKIYIDTLEDINKLIPCLIKVNSFQESQIKHFLKSHFGDIVYFDGFDADYFSIDSDIKAYNDAVYNKSVKT